MNEIDLCHKLLDIEVIMAVELFNVIFMMNLTEIYSDVKRIKFYLMQLNFNNKRNEIHLNVTNLSNCKSD